MVRPSAPAASSSAASSPACAVCDADDARTLTTTPLASGALVFVCGSHAVAHTQAARPARTIAELARMCGERRADERRGARASHGEVDELAQALAASFRGERRRESRRGARMTTA